MVNGSDHIRFSPSEIEHVLQEAGSQIRTEEKKIVRLMFGIRKHVATMCMWNPFDFVPRAQN